MQESSSRKAQLENQFLGIINALNPAQREAVEHTEGPVMVLAGPGTGKTQLLAARIGYILYNTDTQPYNILCLTYTEAGVAAMRDRLKSFIGSSANQVRIHTFHSYCHTIIQDHFHLFGRSELEPLDELERIEIVRAMIDELPVQNILKQSNLPYINEKKISAFLRMMKSETWSVEEVKKATASYIESLPEREEFIYKRKYKEFAKGDLKENMVLKEKIKMQKLDAAADLFPVYKEKLKKAQRYDFEDMIIWVLNAFKNNPDLLQEQQEQFYYILVDEFQDTNGAQYDLIDQLISFWEEPNIFVVGDDDQSIFEFQGARLSNTKDFIEKYQAQLKMIMLNQNYRSSKNILEASAHLINYNDTRLKHILDPDANHVLSASNPKVSDSTFEPEIQVYRNLFQEQIAIVDKIETSYLNKEDLSEIAIIYAKHKQVEIIEDLLLKKNIPFQTRRRKDILSHFIVEEILYFLSFIEKEKRQPLRGDYFLIKILHFELLQLNPNDFAKMQFYMASHKEDLDKSWRQLIGNESLLEELGIKDIQKLLKLSETFNELIILSERIAVPEMVQKLVNALGILQYVINHESHKEYLQILRTFFNYIEVETKKDKRQNLKTFIERLQKMQELNISIPMTKVYGNELGVNLLTAHSSKGLEFGTVYMIDCLKSKWEPGRSNQFNFSMPDTLTFSGDDDSLEAKRRLFYVSMTRAKEKLYFSYALEDNKNKPQQNTLFLDELIEQEDFKKTEIDEDEAVTTKALFESMTVAPSLLINENIDVDKLIENFEMSASALNSYLDCPLRFYYEQILKVPSLNSEAATYGTAIHNALRSFFDKRNHAQSEEEQATKNDLIHFFQKEMNNYVSNFSDAGFKFRLEKGMMVLSNLFDQQKDSWPEKVKLELPLRNVNYREVQLKGFIDRLDIQDEQHAIIVDYKTGSNPLAKLRKPTKANPYGGTYWRQLVFYKILCEAAPELKQTITAAAVASLEPDEKGMLNNHSISIQDDDLKLIGGLIEESWESIKNKEFEQGCGKPTCDWCTLISKHTKQAERAPEL